MSNFIKWYGIDNWVDLAAAASLDIIITELTTIIIIKLCNQNLIEWDGNGNTLNIKGNRCLT